MPDPVTPGVFVDDGGPGPPPIEGVSTSTAGFVGLTERGPMQPRVVTSWLEYQQWFGGLVPPAVSYLPWAVRGFFENGGKRLFVARVVGKGAAPAALELDGPSKLTIEALGPGRLEGRLLVRVAEPSRLDPARVRITVRYEGAGPDACDPEGGEPDVVEDFDDLASDEIEAALQASTLVVARFDLGQAPSLPLPLSFTPLTGGTDGEAIAAVDFLGDDGVPPERRIGLAGLGAVDEISLLCVPDDVTFPELQADVLAECERPMDRFAILQIGAGQSDPVYVTAPSASSYGAIYHPWIRVPDGATQPPCLIPPGGHLAGIYAANDQQRGVHKAPANIELRGLVHGDDPGSPPLEFALSDRDATLLGSNGINVIRDFRAVGRGVRVWSARTMSDDTEWKYVSVRRLLIFLEQSIDKGIQWVVFEPNDESTWASVRRTVVGFLDGQWRAGAFAGNAPNEAYFVECDRTTMTQDDLDEGRLVCVVGVAPIRPAEFVILRIGMWTAAAQC